MDLHSENYSVDGTISSLKQQTLTHSHGLSRSLSIIAQKHFSPFKMFVDREHRIVVILNPKVGTTTFRCLVAGAYREVLGYNDVSNGRYKLIRKARQFPFPPLADYFHVFAEPEQYDFYCFVRNPYARLKSAWIDKIAFGHQSEYPRSIRGKVIHQMRRFAAEHHLPGSKPKSAVPFSTFIAYIDAQTAGNRNHHWDEQYSVLMMDRIRYSQIYKMETQFASGMECIFTRMGIPETWTKKAMQQPQNESKKILGKMFTEDLAMQVQRISARDFRMFGYDVDSWKMM